METIYSNIFRCNYLRNEKYFLNFFLNFLNVDSILKISKQRWPWYLVYFWIYGLRKTWLDKCLKSPVSEDASTSNMVNGPKHCSKLADSTFTIFINPCEGNSGLKRLSEWYAKSSDILLTHWVSIISILFLTRAIYCIIFRWNYLRHGKYFLDFFFHLLILNSILNILKKKLTLIADVFWNLRIPTDVVR